MADGLGGSGGKLLAVVAAMIVVGGVLGPENVLAGSWATVDPPGSYEASVNGVDGGNVVGYYEDVDYYMHGFLYDGTAWADLDAPGADDTFAYGIDGANIVGYYRDAVNYDAHGFLYDGATWTPLDAPGAEETVAIGIDGANIVGAYEDASDNMHGFLYDGALWTGLDAPGATKTLACGIDGDTVVGYYYDASGYDHGFLYDISTSTWTTPLDAPGAEDTFACGIDGSTVVGYYYDASSYVHGFLYDGATWSDFTGPSAYTAVPYDIDGSKIVGEAPVFERYYAGGIGSLRGFDYRGVSPRGGIKLDPIGSDYLFLAGTELTHPLYEETIYGKIFCDSGLISEGPYRVSVGFGLELVIPQLFQMIPMNFNFGFPLVTDENDDEELFSFSFGGSHSF